MRPQSYACFACAAQTEGKFAVPCLELPHISLSKGADSPIYLDTARLAIQQRATQTLLARALSQ